MAIAFVFPVFGGASSQVSILLFGTIFLFSVSKAFAHVRRREIAEHREWMIRAFALALGISTFRLVLGPAALLAGLWDGWNLSIWLSFALNLAVAEAWIRTTRPARRRLRPVTFTDDQAGSRSSLPPTTR